MIFDQIVIIILNKIILPRIIIHDIIVTNNCWVKIKVANNYFLEKEMP